MRSLSRRRSRPGRPAARVGGEGRDNCGDVGARDRGGFCWDCVHSARRHTVEHEQLCSGKQARGARGGAVRCGGAGGARRGGAGDGARAREDGRARDGAVLDRQRVSTRADELAGVQDREGRAVERTQGDAVHSVGLRNRDAGRSVPSEDTGSDGKGQLSTVLGESEVLCDWGRDGQAVSVAERGSTASIRSATDKGWDLGNRRARICGDRRQSVYWVAQEAAQGGGMGADVQQRDGDSD
ncbi:hypothetical protein OPT61_g3159 [Boeremia exigua]|uniref:Uncharacterized protein n=1 Tax=Boeremia exigua TaxID=749465 RepID=A0ACC2IIZ5_9PLEO|nr:hypothetical protein OPT61_g3159 [Boeremia exigua]